MPELPEVETVRRGLAAGHGRRAFRQGRGASRRPALAAAEGFRCSGSQARPSRGLGRRAKYLLADLSVRRRAADASRHVRLVPRITAAAQTPGTYYHERSKQLAHDHVVFHMSNGATVTFNDPRRFGSMKLVAARRA